MFSPIRPPQDKSVGSDLWQVDTANKDKILTVTSETVTENEVIEAVKKAGFKIEAL